MNPFFLLTVAVAISMLVIPLAWRLAPRFGLVDMPDPRKVHSVPVPRIGGWGITIGSLVPLALAFHLDPLLQSLLIGTVTLFLFGVWDDARQINHWLKFAGQFIAVGVIVYYGDLYVTRLPFFEGDVLSAAFGKPFTMFAMVGMINAMNHSDGLDGLAGGESLLSLIAVAILGYSVSDTVMVGISLAMIGGILGFLRYNSHPARVFMGDGGSQVLGLTLGFLAVYLTQRSGAAMSAALPLLLFGVPVADILVVLYQRATGGMNWFRATRNHAHHRLLDLGFSHYETVVIIYTLHAALVVAALLLRYALDAIVVGVFALVIGALYVTLIVAEQRHWRLATRAPRLSRLGAFIARLNLEQALREITLLLIAILIPAFTLLAALRTARVPQDFGIVAVLLGAGVLGALALRRAAGPMLLRATSYVAALFSAYLLIHFPGAHGAGDRAVALTVIVVLAVAVGAHIRVTSEERFRTTPTDFLIVFGMLALMVLGLINVDSRDTVDLVIYATVLLYGSEVIIGQATRHRAALLVVTLATLLLLGWRGLV